MPLKKKKILLISTWSVAWEVFLVTFNINYGS